MNVCHREEEEKRRNQGEDRIVTKTTVPTACEPTASGVNSMLFPVRGGGTNVAKFSRRSASRRKVESSFHLLIEMSGSGIFAQSAVLGEHESKEG